jgi:hypothetical protein
MPAHARKAYNTHMVVAEPTPASVAAVAARLEPVAEGLRTLRKDHLLGAFQYLAFDTFDALTKSPTITMTDRRNAALTMAICTDKALLLSGQPTSIVAGVQVHRHDVGDLVSRLAHLTQRALPQG